MPALVPPRDLATTELLRWLFDRLNEHDIPSMRQLWTVSTVAHFPDVTCRGADEVAAYFADKFAAIDKFHLHVMAIAESGDDALVHWRMTGRHIGTLLGIAGTGKEIELDGIDHFVLRDDKIATNTVVFDQMKFARQVGLLPPDGSVADKALKTAFNAKTRVAMAARGRLGHSTAAPSAVS
jgi:steroid delta-isomerase-like uncharacterized protein